MEIGNRENWKSWKLEIVKIGNPAKYWKSTNKKDFVNPNRFSFVAIFLIFFWLRLVLMNYRFEPLIEKNRLIVRCPPISYLFNLCVYVCVPTRKNEGRNKKKWKESKKRFNQKQSKIKRSISLNLIWLAVYLKVSTN